MIPEGRHRVVQRSQEEIAKIEQAKDVLMEKFNIDEPEAHRMLQSQATMARVTKMEIVEQILNGNVPNIVSNTQKSRDKKQLDLQRIKWLLRCKQKWWSACPHFILDELAKDMIKENLYDADVPLDIVKRLVKTHIANLRKYHNVTPD